MGQGPVKGRGGLPPPQVPHRGLTTRAAYFAALGPGGWWQPLSLAAAALSSPEDPGGEAGAPLPKGCLRPLHAPQDETWATGIGAPQSPGEDVCGGRGERERLPQLSGGQARTPALSSLLKHPQFGRPWTNVCGINV